MLPTEASTVEARLEARGFLVDDAAHRARDELRGAAGFVQLVGAVALVMARGDDGVPREMRKRLVGMMLLEMRGHRLQRGRIPE